MLRHGGKTEQVQRPLPRGFDRSAKSSLIREEPLQTLFRVRLGQGRITFVRKGNPSKIASLSDISKPGLIYVTCAPQVPIGKYSAQVLQKAGVTVAPASLEPDVKSIVAKVTAGEADAGIVYATDVSATQGAAEGVVIPTDVNVTAHYPIAAVSTSTNRTAAQAWIAFVSGTEGQAILKNYGFGSP